MKINKTTLLVCILFTLTNISFILVISDILKISVESPVNFKFGLLFLIMYVLNVCTMNTYIKED